MDSLNTLLLVLLLLLDVLAILHVWCRSIEIGRKVVWSMVILLLPVVGLIMWAIAAAPFGKVRL
ncbi:hypothetical protein YO5_06116 [Stutzerimonas stutzeri TS44]|nr:hypothetical protein YO5_06116 [Stutzerimonas stutzeri TS44]